MIEEKLLLVPHKPGCYLMKNSDNNIIYVGKSKNLKNRLSSYFKQSHTGKTAMLVKDITDFEYIITSTEMESLLLELNLIKKYSPKYNILLKDDKTYPYIELTNDIYPRLVVVRNPNIRKNKNIKLFGPYPNVTAARTTVDLINRIYPLRKCKNLGKKECLYYHINECLGYCIKEIDKDKINNMRSEIISFLNGNHTNITNKIINKMNSYAEKLEYEKAIEYKELLDYITITLEKQKVELEDNKDIDVVGYYTDNNYISIVLLFIRGGKLLDKKNDIFPMVDTKEEELTTYISKFYDKHKIKPNETYVPDIIDCELLSSTFSLKFLTPIKGTKKKIMNLANENALNYFNEQISLVKKDEEKTNSSMKELSELLNINNLSRIELFDNSNLFGTFNVSAMVVFIDGKPIKNEYRKYKIESNKNDDYNTMREVIYRRYYRVLKDKLVIPDLIIVDGGLGQLNKAIEVINSLNMSIPVASLKKDDKHNTSCLLYEGREIPIDKTSNLFLLLVKMQNEIHNFTINYHKQIRSKGMVESVLDNIKGFGKKRKELIIKKYKNITNMKKASFEELSEMLPKDVANSLYNTLKNV